MKIKRRTSKVVKIGAVTIGANFPIAIQSMVKTKASDKEATIKQIKKLERAGCEIVRLAIRDSFDARALKKIRTSTSLPLVADIHFNWRLAIEAIENGADKIRLNPGNIYRKKEIKNIVSALKQANIPLRVGVNSGSLSRTENREPKTENRATLMVKKALDYIRIIEKFGFYDIVVSLKASNILDTIEAYRKIAGQCNYPLHLGVTATGSLYSGTVKSSIALGILLLEGIGDTIRVSLTDEPRNEVKVAQCILESLGLRNFGLEIISCPTCGRCQVDLLRLVGVLEKKLSAIHYPLSAKPLKLALMGCEVNGPGEAREADIGIAFGKKDGLLFRKGKMIKKIPADSCQEFLTKEIRRYYQ